MAQTATSAEDSQPDAIVVTARQRSELLQDVPLSITAFSSENLRDAGVERVDDIIQLTPNITFVNSQSPGTSFITIRGLTQNRNQPAPVAIVVDGVLQTSDREFAAGLLDIDSIEVVRGPQGALYGRNATGGAIIINTKRPTNYTEGHFQLGAANGGEFSAEGTISGPIIEDKLFARISGRVITRDGYFNNVVLSKKVDPLDDYTIQSLITYTPTPELTIDLHANYSQTRAGALNLTYQPANINADYTLNADDPFDYSRGDANDVNRTFYANNIGDSFREITSISARVAYEMDFATLTSVTAFTGVNEVFTSDQFPYTASRNSLAPGYLVDGGQSQYVTTKAISQELRLTSGDDGPLRWMVGGYFVGTNRFISTTTSEDLGFGVIKLKRTPQFDNPYNPTLSFIADNNHDRAWALFGNIEYDLTDRLEAGFALRYDRDNRKQFVSPYSTTGAPGATNKTHYDRLQPKVSLTYNVNDNVRLFASYGVGFRSGQFNQNGVGAAASTIGLDGVSDIAKQEETQSYEAGFKAQLFDRRLTLNGTLFRTDADNVQYFVFVGAISAQVLVNIDKVRITGGELEANLRLFEGLSANAGLGITDSKIRRYALNPAAVGNKAPFVPNKTVNAGLQYAIPVGNMTLTPRVDYELRGKQYWSPENITARKDLNLVNLRLTLAGPDDRFDLAGWVKNVGDLKYNEEYGSGGFAYAANPRTYGVTLRYNY